MPDIHHGADGFEEQIRAALASTVLPVDKQAIVNAVHRRAALRQRRHRAGLAALAVIVAAGVSTGIAVVTGGGRTPAAAHAATSPAARSASSASSPAVPHGAGQAGANAKGPLSQPAVLPPACPAGLSTPLWISGRFCGPVPPAGNGSGIAGQCTSADTAAPCGPGVVPGRYYAYTLPGSCDGLIIFDGRKWLSELPPPSPQPPAHVWMVLTEDGNAGFIAPYGAVGFVPYTGQALPICRQ